MSNNQYIRTDLAAECPALEEKKTLPGISFHTEKGKSTETATIKVLDKNGEKQLGKPIGTYVTVSFGKVWTLPDEELNNIIETVSEKIKELTSLLVPDKEKLTILVAGLGNRYITSDAIGPLTVKEITVTRHVKNKDKKLFDMLNQQTISAISPGVLGQTGIETVELIKGAVDTVRPDLVVVVDALAARNVNRLATTVQICDTGISPGSGIGNTRQAINQETLGVPVIALGVPTMVSSATLVYNALEKAEVDHISQELMEVLDNSISFFVTLNETDAVVNTISHLLSESINRAFCLS